MRISQRRSTNQITIRANETPRPVLAFALGLLTLRDTSFSPISDVPLIASIIRTATVAVLEAPRAISSVGFALRRLTDQAQGSGAAAADKATEASKTTVVKVSQLMELLEKEDASEHSSSAFDLLGSSGGQGGNKEAAVAVAVPVGVLMVTQLRRKSQLPQPATASPLAGWAVHWLGFGAPCTPSFCRSLPPARCTFNPRQP